VGIAVGIATQQAFIPDEVGLLERWREDLHPHALSYRPN
jgi:hypothetical protein